MTIPVGPSGAITWNVLTGTSNTPGAIARWLNKSTLTSGTGGDADLILQEALGWVFTRLRHYRMLMPPVSAFMFAGSGGDQIFLTPDVLEIDFLMISGTASGALYELELIQRQPNDIYRSWTYNGSGSRIAQMPTMYSFNSSFIQLDSIPDLAYPYIYTYYAFLPTLDSQNQSNFITIYYPRLLRCVCMMMGAEWTKESNQGQYDRTYWETEALKELMEAQAQSDRARRASVNVPTYPGGTPGYVAWGGVEAVY
jgi:hypothetical protein